MYVPPTTYLHPTYLQSTIYCLLILQEMLAPQKKPWSSKLAMLSLVNLPRLSK
jgi:hypothetical protein